jgi:hypothetical protein
VDSSQYNCCGSSRAESRELLPELIRQASTRLLTAACSVQALPTRPAICADKNGRGFGYRKLRYRLPHAPARRQSLYLGELSQAEVELLEGLIAQRWRPAARHDDELRIERLIDMRAAIRKVATSVAARRVCWFRGYDLHPLKEWTP